MENRHQAGVSGFVVLKGFVFVTRTNQAIICRYSLKNKTLVANGSTQYNSVVKSIARFDDNIIVCYEADEWLYAFNTELKDGFRVYVGVVYKQLETVNDTTIVAQKDQSHFDIITIKNKTITLRQELILNISSYVSFTVTNDLNIIIINAGKQSITCIDQKGEVKWEVRNLRFASDITIDQYGNLFVLYMGNGHKQNHVIYVKSDGSYSRVILSELYPKVNPGVIIVDERGTLYISFNQLIHIFEFD